MDEEIRQTVDILGRAKKVVALTGAGISVESGIPPFRGKGGVWERIDPMKYAYVDALYDNPVEVWEVLLKEMSIMVQTARPNDGHRGLARLEKMGVLQTIITQNVDGLHQQAGNTDVIEFHGNFANQYCMKCGRRSVTARLDLTVLPPRCECGGIFRPDCVFFGENISPQHLARAYQLSMSCDVMLVIGTSAEVQPAASMPETAKASGATVIEINPEKTTLTRYTSDYLIRGKAGQVMQRLVEALAQKDEILDVD